MTAPLLIDLCCGLGGWSEPFEDNGWRTVGIDIRSDLEADVVADVRNLPLREGLNPTLVTVSPPCTDFTRYHLPWYDDDDPSLELVEACLQAVESLRPEWWVLENVVGLHSYWRTARKHVGPFYLWGNFPPFDASKPQKGKMQTSGMNPEERAKIPYHLADALRRSVEWYL